MSVNDQMDDLRYTHFPYCIERVENGKFVLLNRHYKPLGVLTDDRVDYAPWAVSIRGLTSKVAVKLSVDGSESLERIWLYDDMCVPTRTPGCMKAYQDRLAVLAKLKRGRPREKD